MRGSRPHNPNADHIEIDGIWFYKETKGLYYLGNVPDETGKRRPVRAHHYVWSKHYGAVPKGCSIHHKDKNPRNNNIDNLELLSYSKHSHIHASEHCEESRKRMEEIVRPMAIQWHKSEDGNEWHKEHYEKVTREVWQTLVTKKCEICGCEYQVKSFCASRSKYCSQKCKRKSQVHKDYLENNKAPRQCPICGKTFLVYKHSRQITCGKACANISQSRKKTGKPRPY